MRAHPAQLQCSIIASWHHSGLITFTSSMENFNLLSIGAEFGVVDFNLVFTGTDSGVKEFNLSLAGSQLFWKTCHRERF